MESKKIKRLMCSVITATLLLCELPGVAPMMESVGVVQEVEAASRKLSSTKVSVMTGEKSKITLKGVSSKKKKSVKWKSNSKNLVVSYSKKDTRSATFYARKAGTYKVTATYGKKTYVAVVKASKKGMNVTSRTLDKGQKYTLKLKGVKGKAKWSSSKKSVVTVKTIKNGKGAVITAKKPGSATITATVGEKKIVCVVKVKGTTAVVTPKPNPTTAPKPTDTPKPQPTTSPKPTETPNPKPTEIPSPTPTPVVVPATGISLDDTKIGLDVECPTWELSCKVEPKNSTQKDVVWESDNTKVVTVSNYGELTAIGNGTTKVRCYVKENRSIYAECVVTVDLSSKEPETKPEPTKPVEPKPEPTKPVDPKPTEPEVVKVSGITLNPDINLKIEEGNSSKITATVVPSNATNSSVKWVSSSPDVATVDDSGNVTAIKAGSTDITCTAVDGSGVSAVCHVTVTAKDIVDPGDTTDPLYSCDYEADFDYYSSIPGGTGLSIDVFTNAPSDKVQVLTSNNNIYYNGVFVKRNVYGYSYYYCFGLDAVKQGNCDVSLIVNGKTIKTWNAYVSSTDKNWATYESWLNSVLKNIEAANSNWKDITQIQKITLLGQYILDNYDYNADPNKSFHNDGCGNCNASSFVLKDYAQRLGLRSEVVTPSYWVNKNSSHVVARIYYDGNTYDFEAGYNGEAGKRGKVGIVINSK